MAEVVWGNGVEVAVIRGVPPARFFFFKISEAPRLQEI